MADKYTLRRFIMFKAIIRRIDRPAKFTDKWLADHPEVTEEFEGSEHTWDQWNALLPATKLIEDVNVSEAYL